MLQEAIKISSSILFINFIKRLEMVANKNQTKTVTLTKASYHLYWVRPIKYSERWNLVHAKKISFNRSLNHE